MPNYEKEVNDLEKRWPSVDLMRIGESFQIVLVVLVTSTGLKKKRRKSHYSSHAD